MCETNGTGENGQYIPSTCSQSFRVFKQVISLVRLGRFPAVYLCEQSTWIYYLVMVIINISSVLLLFAVHCTGKNKYEIIQNFCKTYVPATDAIVTNISVHCNLLFFKNSRYRHAIPILFIGPFIKRGFFNYSNIQCNLFHLTGMLYSVTINKILGKFRCHISIMFSKRFYLFTTKLSIQST